jgi:hypothetical protein
MGDAVALDKGARSKGEGPKTHIGFRLVESLKARGPGATPVSRRRCARPGSARRSEKEKGMSGGRPPSGACRRLERRSRLSALNRTNNLLLAI